MRKQQLYDMVQWCTENAGDDFKGLCNSVLDTVTTETEYTSEFSWILQRTINPETPGRQLLNIKPWDLAQYLAIYDFLYISQMLSNTPVDDLLATIARDDMSILTNPDMRADQVRPSENVTDIRFNIG